MVDSLYNQSGISESISSPRRWTLCNICYMCTFRQSKRNEESTLTSVSLVLPLSRIRASLGWQIHLVVWRCLHADRAPLVRLADHKLRYSDGQYSSHSTTSCHPHESGDRLPDRSLPTADHHCH